MKQGYDQKLVDEQLEKVGKLVRDDLLQEKYREQQDPKPIALILTISFYKRNKNLKEIGSRRIENGKIKKFNIPSRTGKCSPCLRGAKTLSCNQVVTANTFMSQQTKGTSDILFNLNCKSQYVIYLLYLLECIL